MKPSLSDLLLGALGLLFIAEGLLPFLNPKGWRRVFESALKLHDGQIRFIGMVSVALGAVMLLLWR